MRRALLTVAIGLASVCSIGVTAAQAATLNPRAVRTEIARQITTTYPGLSYGNVACPDGIAKKAGSRFVCTVQLPGTFLVVDATQADGRGTVTFETSQAVLTKQSLEEFVAANASLPAMVSCGSTTWLVLRPAQQLTCHANLADGSMHDVQLTVRDSVGNVTITGAS